MKILPLFLLLTSTPAWSLAPELQDWCRSLSKDLMSVKLDRCLSKDWVIAGRSVKNRPIPYADWGAPEGKRVLILGSLHGDEISSVSLAFRWLDFLSNTRKESFLRTLHFRVAPLINPDGYFVRPRTRQNANGVDLNRNFATKDWDKVALRYWKTRAKSEPRRYPGKVAASEPETQLMQKMLEEFKPQIIISIHAPYGLIDHDGELMFPKEKCFLPVKKLGAFPGSLGQYEGVERGVPVITVELEAALKMPDQKQVEDLFVFLMKAK